METTIDKVSEENVIRFWAIATDLEELHEVVELAVYVATDGDGRVHVLDVGLLEQDVTCKIAKLPHFSFFDAVTALQTGNPAVNIRCLLRAQRRCSINTHELLLGHQGANRRAIRIVVVNNLYFILAFASGLHRLIT